MFYNKIPKLSVISNVTRSGGDFVAEILGTFFLVLAVCSLTEQKSNKTSLVVGFLVGCMILAPCLPILKLPLPECLLIPQQE